MSANTSYAPAFLLEIDGLPIPADLRSSVASLQFQTGLEGVDRVEISLVNTHLRWLDSDLLALDKELALSFGYTPDPLKKVFIGQIVGLSPTFPASGIPMLNVIAQDRRQHLQKGAKTRWFAIPLPKVGNVPIPDAAVAAAVTASNQLTPIFDPISAAFSVLVGGTETVLALAANNPTVVQALIRKQAGENNFDFLKRISHENGWEINMDYDAPRGGYKLHFLSLAEHLAPTVTLKYGKSLIDFTPRISKVGEVASFSTKLWISSIKQEFTASVAYDWERKSLSVTISPGSGFQGSSSGKASDAKAKSEMTDPDMRLVDEPLGPHSAPRFLLSKLLEKLNQRLTGSGSAIGDVHIQAGTVLKLEGLGRQFGGLYRVTSAMHTLDASGYRTNFEVRKEIWFENIPGPDQGAIKLVPQLKAS